MDKLNRDFMALPDDGKRMAFLADFLIMHAKAYSTYEPLEPEKAMAAFKKQWETVEEMACKSGGMPE